MKPGNPLLVLTLTLAFVSGCATNGTNNQYKKPLCVLAGAAIGGAAGNAVDDDVPVAAVGAVAGGAIAWLFCADESDSDGDGVIDSKDDCSGTPKGVAVNARGCPLDRDGDGVYDSDDRCPNTPAGVRVDSQGCALDSDGDGIADGRDRCPDTPRNVAVDSAGCPMDGDGDGVYDSMDQCPDTPAGMAVNERGCHTILSLKGVNFKLNSSELERDARNELDAVVKMLNDDQRIRLSVEGHTDSSGADSYNQRLSQQRAEAVVDYLVKNGISRSRLTARGYGETRPVADNNTPQGRASNRRVDLVDSK
jgi:OOP family OmpA-OmpF porin